MPRQDQPLYEYPMSQLYRDALDPDVQEILKDETQMSLEQFPPPDSHPPRFVNGHWEFWSEESLEEHKETPLEKGIRHELEWRYPTEAMARFQWALLNLALHGLEYAQHPDKYPFPQPKGIALMTTKPPAKPPPAPPKPSTQPRAKGGMRLPEIGKPDGEHTRGPG